MISNRTITKLVCITLLQIPVATVELADTSTLPVLSGSQYIQVVHAKPTVTKPVVSTISVNENIIYTKPDTVTLPVPFYAQAPTGNWDMPFQEACEEASMLLLHYYLQNYKPTKETVTADIIDLTNYVATNTLHTSMALRDVKSVLQSYFTYNSTIITDPTPETIEGLLDAGYPIIVPAAGRLLGNPYFTGDGPAYHMFVISGYNETEFIVQEVGTIFGNNYTYNKQVLMQAIADWTGSNETIQSGQSAILVVQPV